MTTFVIFLVGCFLSYWYGCLRTARLATERYDQALAIAAQAVAELARSQKIRDEAKVILDLCREISTGIEA